MKKALVVGINGYGFPNDLGSAVRDAEAFANVLDTVYRFDDVRVLTDGDATRDGVDRGLEWLCQSANTNDRLVVFFSGHGCRFERNGVLEDALVLQDGRLLDHHHLADRMENVPPGVLTLVIDACFSGPDQTLIHPSGQVEVVRAKRWIPTELDRGRSERSVTPGLKAFAPFGHVKPAAPSTLAAHIRNAAPVDRPPARLTTLDEPQAKAVIVLPCLADETTPVAHGAYQQPYGGGFSPFGQGVQGSQGWPGAQGQGWWQGGFQSPYAQGFHGQSGANLQPYEIAQIVSAVTPLVVSLLQSRNYQGHFGQFLPRAA